MAFKINAVYIIQVTRKTIKETYVSLQLWRFLTPGNHTAGLSTPWIGDCHMAQQQSAEDI